MLGLSRNRAHHLIVAGVLLAAIAVLGVVGAMSAGWLGSQPAQARKPLIIQGGGLKAESTPQERVAAASVIVLGTVTESLGSRWNTPSGTLPEEVANGDDFPSGEYQIFTDYSVKVESVLYGDVGGDTVRVRVDGGQVGQDRLVMHGAAELEPGQRVVLLLIPDDNPLTKDIGPQHYIVYWGSEGHYRVANGEAVTTDHRISLSELPAFILEAKR